MTPADVIRQAQEDASEWIEMSDNPSQIVVGVLATRIVNMSNYINYLENRLKHVCSTESSVN